MIFLFKQVIFRFHVSFRGCTILFLSFFGKGFDSMNLMKLWKEKTTSWMLFMAVSMAVSNQASNGEKSSTERLPPTFKSIPYLDSWRGRVEFTLSGSSK